MSGNLCYALMSAVRNERRIWERARSENHKCSDAMEALRLVASPCMMRRTKLSTRGPRHVGNRKPCRLDVMFRGSRMGPSCSGDQTFLLPVRDGPRRAMKPFQAGPRCPPRECASHRDLRSCGAARHRCRPISLNRMQLPIVRTPQARQGSLCRRADMGAQAWGDPDARGLEPEGRAVPLNFREKPVMRQLLDQWSHPAFASVEGFSELLDATRRVEGGVGMADWTRDPSTRGAAAFRPAGLNQVPAGSPPRSC